MFIASAPGLGLVLLVLALQWLGKLRLGIPGFIRPGVGYSKNCSLRTWSTCPHGLSLFVLAISTPVPRTRYSRSRYSRTRYYRSWYSRTRYFRTRYSRTRYSCTRYSRTRLVVHTRIINNSDGDRQL